MDDDTDACAAVWPMLPLSLGDMVTYYCISLEEALRRAKAAGKQPGCYYGGIILPSGRRGFAVYKDGKAVEQYTASKLEADVFRR